MAEDRPKSPRRRVSPPEKGWTLGAGGLPHAFWAYMDIPESREANALMASFLKRQLELAE